MSQGGHTLEKLYSVHDFQLTVECTTSAYITHDDHALTYCFLKFNCCHNSTAFSDILAVEGFALFNIYLFKIIYTR